MSGAEGRGGVGPGSSAVAGTGKETLKSLWPDTRNDTDGPS